MVAVAIPGVNVPVCVLGFPGDVLGAVADAFDRGEHEEQDRAGRHDARIGLHLGLQRLDAAAIEPSTSSSRSITESHFGVAFAVGAHRVGQHRLRDRGDLPDLDRRRPHRDVDQLDRVLRDVHRVVADPLEVGDDLEGAAIARSSLATGCCFQISSMQAPRRAAGVVDLVVAGDDAAARAPSRRSSACVAERMASSVSAPRRTTSRRALSRA
jgi:hypothetical protein